ncbi:hypothetical protein PR048_033265 [Dryococelus australis]|uniref:Uncharacterized protein n=1 Tax=Dryococelus australis TaxID=614101 RepID=A0ABQ9FZT3_9NEOP|nr:hypothetical protein PR048_033265 [Dryococelus australis]
MQRARNTTLSSSLFVPNKHCNLRTIVDSQSVDVDNLRLCLRALTTNPKDHATDLLQNPKLRTDYSACYLVAMCVGNMASLGVLPLHNLRQRTISSRLKGFSCARRFAAGSIDNVKARHWSDFPYRSSAGYRSLPRWPVLPVLSTHQYEKTDLMEGLYWRGRCGATRYDGNTARLARRGDEALGVRVSVARIAPSLLGLGRRVPKGSISLLILSLKERRNVDDTWECQNKLQVITFHLDTAQVLDSLKRTRGSAQLTNQRIGGERPDIYRLFTGLKKCSLYREQPITTCASPSSLIATSYSI